LAYGGMWTVIKLEVVEKYLDFYFKAMKNQNFELCYIDAFAGEGEVDVKKIGTIPGSALRALDCPFDRYIFIEKDQRNSDKLAEAVGKSGKTNAEIITGDCNQLLKTIDSANWYADSWRGVIFLDPFAMELDWASLEKISHTKVFDVWYLFPLSALIRNLRLDGRIDQSNKARINRVLGTTEWESALYSVSPQRSLFEEEADVKLRASLNSLTKYIVDRLKTVFPGVAESPLILRNDKNSPLFLLCFVVCNPNPKAIQLSLKVANHILASHLALCGD